MSGIVAFLRARLDEDEAVARQAIDYRKRDYAHQPWVDEPDLGFKAWDDHPSGVVMVGPERVLREVEAKRRLVHISKKVASQPPKTDGWDEARARHTLRILATTYSDHPDYREEWEQPGGVGV